MLTIILTSYNRPRFVKRAIDSLLDQTSDNWRLIIKDDGSNKATIKVLESYSDERITLKKRKTTKEERANSSRYAVLINEELDKLDSGIVAYMCDNVEYRPELVETVLAYFEEHNNEFMGYVKHERDAWTHDGKTRLGNAKHFNHWDFTPPVMRDFDRSAHGFLDHSQVFHRLPIDLRWNEDIATVKAGDGGFFDKLIKEYGALVPITEEALTLEHLIK